MRGICGLMAVRFRERLLCVCVRACLIVPLFFFKFGQIAIFRLPSEVNIFGWNILAGEIEGKVRSTTVHEGPEGE
jgi:hypothetical protein